MHSGLLSWPSFYCCPLLSSETIAGLQRSCFAGSAALSSSNVAGAGVLVKSYPHIGSTSTGFPVWDDAQVSYATILPSFPGQPSDPALLVAGLSPPFFAELSGVLVFGNPGPYALALHCAGSCRLFLYGASCFCLDCCLTGASLLKGAYYRMYARRARHLVTHPHSEISGLKGMSWEPHGT
jgi:hypothetical protein